MRPPSLLGLALKVAVERDVYELTGQLKPSIRERDHNRMQLAPTHVRPVKGL